MDIWVYKDDGTRQCGMGKEITLKEMEEQLARIIGERNILSRMKGQLPGVFPDLCGAPNGHVNMYKIAPEGWTILERGIVGPNGFQRWVFGVIVGQDGSHVDVDGPETTFPLSAALHHISSSTTAPVLVRELVGYHLRVVGPKDDVSTLELMPNRVNVFVDDHGTIKQISFF